MNMTPTRMINYKRHFADRFNVEPKMIVEFKPKDGNPENMSLKNMLVTIDIEVGL